MYSKTCNLHTIGNNCANYEQTHRIMKGGFRLQSITKEDREVMLQAILHILSKCGRDL